MTARISWYNTCIIHKWINLPNNISTSSKYNLIPMVMWYRIHRMQTDILPLLNTEDGNVIKVTFSNIFLLNHFGIQFLNSWIIPCYELTVIKMLALKYHCKRANTCIQYGIFIPSAGSSNSASEILIVYN